MQTPKYCKMSSQELMGAVLYINLGIDGVFLSTGLEIEDEGEAF